MKRLTTFLVGLAFATAGGIGAASADSFPMPLPSGVTISSVVGTIQQNVTIVDSNSQLDGINNIVVDPTGLFIAWFENPTVDQVDFDPAFADILTSIVWEVFDSATNVLLATGGLAYDHTNPFVFSSNATSLDFRVRNFNGAGATTGNFNIGFAVAIIPEPATWIMMILGFGLIGLQMRRQARTRVEMA